MTTPSKIALGVLVLVWLIGGILIATRQQQPSPQTPTTPKTENQTHAEPLVPALPPETARLFERLAMNIDSDVPTLKADTLAEYNKPETAEKIRQALTDPKTEPEATNAALNLIYRKNDVASFKQELLNIEKSGKAESKTTAASLLMSLPGKDGIDTVSKYSTAENDELRQAAIHAAAQRTDAESLKTTVPLLIDALSDKTPLIRKIAINALKKIAEKPFDNYQYGKPLADNAAAINDVRAWATGAGYAVR